MAQYKLTNKAVEDLTGIWNYTCGKWSEQQADRYYELLLESCRSIANNPNLGKKYEGINNGLFGIKVNKHIVFYRVNSDNPVEITRILHERMDLENRINE